MLYQFYEWNHAALMPLRAAADATKLLYQNPLNPLSHTAAGRSLAAMAELFERTTRIYGKPEFELYETMVGGHRVPVQDRTVWRKPFARLLHFERELPKNHAKDPRFLIVAPLSGHHATLLRGTVEALLPYGDVHIADWTDARDVAVSHGKFDLEDYTDYVVEMLRFLGPDTHVIAVCQPAVPVLMAVARMEEDGDDCAPATMTLMGGPIDTRINPTAVNELAKEKGIDWFRENVITTVPFPHEGFMRSVYPGFLQLTGFMSMNLDRHMIAHKDFFWNLVKEDGDSADRHRAFYDEYNAVMDMTAEFYLQTVDEVFCKHSLPKGTLMYHGRPIDLTKIRNTALLTIEGENDDISGVGQTEAAQDLCYNIPEDKRVHYVQPKVGHYGVFNGSRFRAEICPRIVDFALTHGTTHASAKLPKKPRPDPQAKGRQRTGAVKEREAKAGELGRNAAKSGETVLAGAAVPDAASALKAATAPAEALMKTALDGAADMKKPEAPEKETAGEKAAEKKAQGSKATGDAAATARNAATAKAAAPANENGKAQHPAPSETASPALAPLKDEMAKTSSAAARESAPAKTVEASGTKAPPATGKGATDRGAESKGAGDEPAQSTASPAKAPATPQKSDGPKPARAAKRRKPGPRRPGTPASRGKPRR